MKFGFTENLYSYIMLIPKWKRARFTRKVIEYGLYETEPKLSKKERKVWDCVTNEIREEKKLRQLRQASGQLGGQKRSENRRKQVKKTESSKMKQEASKTKQIYTPSKKQVELFCLSHSLNISNEDLKTIYQQIQKNAKDWRNYILTNY